MKLLTAAVLALASLAIANPLPIDDQLVENSVVEKRASAPSVSGLKFDIDGTTAYYVGTNAYWIGYLTDNADVDTVFTHLKASGLKVLRVWGTLFFLRLSTFH
jgi:mannan endo-1,4-beta-mannosidase